MGYSFCHKALYIFVFLCILSNPYFEGAAANEPRIEFQKHIRPIFVEHCLQCHGPDAGARQADLRLDVREEAIAARPEKEPAIVPGHVKVSLLWQRITSDDPQLIMPPTEHEKPLSKQQISLLRQWIDQGAEYTPHWSFIAPQRPDVPPVPTSSDASRHYDIQNAIDTFVAQILAEKNLSMSPPEHADVLCRRLYLDLIGLPPSPAELDLFVAAAAHDRTTAVNALVNQLLASDHFGEKWARHWMDVARYADSNGFEKDVHRDQWAWRDWLIRALNRDLPYDQFITEQIAGDLLPTPTQDQVVATGFLRNGLVNEEGAIVPEQFRMEGNFDRMDCIGKAILGVSLQCAQCHSHKFDPVSQDEYYGMFAFLNDAAEAQSSVYSVSQLHKIREIETKVSDLAEQCIDAWNKTGEQSADTSWEEDLLVWEQAQHELQKAWTVLDTHEHVWLDGVNHPEELVDHSIVVLGHPTVKGGMYVIAEPKMDGITGLRLEALTYHDLPYGGPGRNSYRGNFVISELSVEVKPPEASNWTAVTLQQATADFSETERIVDGDEAKEKDKRRRVGPVAFMIDGKKMTGWSPDRGPGRRNTDSVAVLQFAEPLHYPSGTTLKISLSFHHSPTGDGRQNTMLGRMRFGITRTTTPTATPYLHAATLAMAKPGTRRTESEQAAVVAAWRSTKTELKQLCDQIAAAYASYPDQTTSVLTLAVRDDADRKTTFLLDRGIWDRPKYQVDPHVPAVLHPLEASRPTADAADPPTRLDFARWLVDKRSPLTARVHVNRVWQTVFGAGLVRTPEDFGTRAPQPDHLQLLDWLAVEFMERGWSTKHLLMTIVKSATYQQSSRASAALRQIDPLNQWFTRGPRFRVEAEVVRDITLTASGLLKRDIGGPSVFPPMPESVLSDLYTRPQYWDVAQDAHRYRRALYIYRKRSMPDPALASLDAPNADAACARRARSNTPLASLVVMNEPIFVEAARALALRILREGGATDRERIDYAFQLCTGRHAHAAQQEEVLALLAMQYDRLNAGELTADAIITGEAAETPEIPSVATPADAAAWTIVARVLLNLDETLSKN